MGKHRRHLYDFQHTNKLGANQSIVSIPFALRASVLRHLHDQQIGMNQIKERRLLLIGYACFCTAIATLSFFGIRNGIPLAWFTFIPFSILIIPLCLQASRSDSYFEQKITQEESWIKRHPVIYFGAAIIGITALAYDIIRRFWG